MNDSVIPNLVIDCAVDHLQSTPLDKLSVTAITQSVGISRVTFYNYFKNREDIIDVLVEVLLAQFDEIQKKNLPFLNLVNMADTKEIKKILYPNTLEIRSFCYKNKKKIACRLSKNTTVDFMDILHGTYYNHFLNALPEIFSAKFSEDTITSYALYMTTGVRAITEEWFLSDFNPSPKIVTERILSVLTPSLMELYTRN